MEKCKGVPLVVRTLDGLFFSKVDEQEWEFVKDNKIWKLKQNESDIFLALRLSYDQMPIHLKQCFAFCSLFPKDHIFYSNELVQMWMANGLILETSINKKTRVGRCWWLVCTLMSCCQDLSSKTLMRIERHPSFPFYTFKMHDLIHDLAIFVTQGECSAIDLSKLGNKDIARTIHYLSLSEMGQEVPKWLDKLTKVCTVTPTALQPLPMSLVEACISRFKYMRLLDLSHSSFEVKSSSIGTMKHLRYLNLSYNIMELPNSICKLRNLQTLRLDGYTKLNRTVARRYKEHDQP